MEELQASVDYLLSNNFDVSRIEVGDAKDLTTLLNNILCPSNVEFQDFSQRHQVIFQSIDNLNLRFKTISTLIINLHAKLSPDHTDEVTTLEDCNQALFSAREAMIYTYRVMSIGRPDLRASLPKTRMAEFFAPIVDDDQKNHQKLMRYYLEQCRMQNLRKKDGVLYRPLMIDDRFTYHYQLYMEIEKFLYTSIYPTSVNQQLFNWLTEKSATVGMCSKYIENCMEDSLPSLVRNRHMFSFRNGLFNALDNTFHVYGDSQLTTRDLTIHFIDQDFEVHEYGDNPMTIPTPAVDTILLSQELNEEHMLWVYAMIGRLIFALNTKDGWQVVPFFLGVAGSGKSTLLNLASKFWSKVDVGSIMTEAQQTFQLEHLYDKLVYFGLDIDHKFNLSQTRFNSMVTAETISIERKHKLAVEMDWDIPGAFAGNVLPRYNDNGGSFSRRLFVIPFNHAIKKSDPDLFRRCMLELGTFLAKTVACYHHVTNKHAKQGLWDQGVLPDLFHQSRRNVQKLTNTAVAFMSNINWVEVDTDFVCSETDLNNKYNAYYKTLSSPSGQTQLSDGNNLFIYSTQGIELITVADRPELSHTYIINGDVITFDSGRYYTGCRPTM